MVRILILILVLPLTAFALIQESGTLTGFLMDTCSTCAYDNWQSHVAERVQRPGYNDYGPLTLDPQTNGFGWFEFIPTGAAGDSTLARWRQVFIGAIYGEWSLADSLIMRYDSLWNYELVEFFDEPSARTYYVMRERLDTIFVDVNGDTLAETDVRGGFRKGWGVFIFSETPRYEKAVLQMPHPEDDFMSIPVGIQMFQQVEMSVLMIAGAGREVMYDSAAGQYNNARSWSDPSRNARHPFAVLSKALTDEWNEPPVNPFVIIQLHSYDHATHAALPDVQVSCYHHDARPNPPVRDVAYNRDFIHAFPFQPITEVDGDTTIDCYVDDYVGLWCDPEYSYYGADTTVIIRSVQDLIGAPDNVEAEYAHIGHSVNYNTENFIHIELDEYPDELWNPLDWVRWLPGTPPTEWSTYAHALEFYAPFISAVDSMLAWHQVPDTVAPDTCELIQITDRANGTATLVWTQSRDRYFSSYQIFYDTVAVTPASRNVTRFTNGYSALGSQFLSTITLSGLLAPYSRYQFAIRAMDMAGNVSPMSEPRGFTDGLISDLTVMVDGDSLRMNWSGQANDSLYEIREYPPNLGGYYWLGVTDTSTFAFAPTGYSGNGVCVLVVVRHLLQSTM